ncbi:hypothetical protein H5410_021177 [Solanum commersonii]|uniref:Uncharacterized protein n=1 Tax=Solanum commersonii TaxID=4109 RepID=A0A9J5ZDH4_SOLCO|nr:hypothetical protein H5410_021177 [Solanum commersonii]
MDSMDNEIQKLKTNEDNLKSKASTSQQHDSKNADLSQSKDFKNPELKGDVGKHFKTHNICLDTVVAPAEILYEEIKPPIQVIKIGLTKDMIIPEDIGQQEEIRKIEIPSFYANKRIIELRKADMDEVQRWILSLLKPEERPTTRALKAGFISPELLIRYCKLIGHKYPDHLCTKCNGEDNVIPDV